MRWKDLENWIKGILIFGLIIYFFFLFISFDPFDPTFKFCQIGLPVNQNIKNFGGKFGSYLTGLIFFLFGKSSYLLLICLLFLGYNIIWGEKENLWKRIVSIVGILSVFSIFLTMINPSFENFNGGFLGTVLSFILKEYFGEKGIFFILGLLLILFISLSYKMYFEPFKVVINNYIFREEKIILPENPVLSERVTKKTFQTRKKIELPEPKSEEEKLETEKEKLKEEKEKKKVKKAPISQRGIVYNFPPIDFLKVGSPTQKETKEDLEIYAQVIEETLSEFDIEGEVVQINQGPRVTMFEVQLAPGIQVQKIFKIQDNIAMNLKTTTIRVVAPLPNKSTVGIEVPNREISIVYLREIVESRDFQRSTSKLTLAIGKDIMGRPIVTDLKLMPHLLIAGATGSGKTVCLNSLITSILYKASPDEVKFILIDPKMVELTLYNDLPHLLCPVIVDIKKAVNALKWLIGEMTRRYKLFSENRIRNVDSYNNIFKDNPLPYIVVVIDELADLMAVAKNEIEHSIIRLAQLSRAAGIHLILATQRPSVNVITGVIKANLPCRISFQVTSKFDSRTILDRIGAEKLLGRGDMLFLPPLSSSLIRIQGSYISDEEIEKVCSFIKKQRIPEYNMEILESKSIEEVGALEILQTEYDDEEALYEQAKRIVITTKIASISMLQRRLRIGFNKAARLIERMEEEGIVGPYQEGKPRKVLINLDNNEQNSEENGFEEFK
ncbi:MAG: DNA translocase FtsK [Candidatus Omnitrophica bacterium]|nr:DNA translocase FtsK [Candidatus Omnitrophota bacterium]MCM8810832.1 DNA translocase FtsK [Candidatus Omnitrophota bacterium]